MSRNHTSTNFDATRLSTLLLPLIAFVVGFAVMFTRTSLDVSPNWAGYLSLAILAGIDSVVGGVRAGIEGKFHSDVFLSGFLVNTVVAVLLAWFGDAIGIRDVYLAAVLVFAWRIFLNISLIRRHFLERARASRVALASMLNPERADEIENQDAGPAPGTRPSGETHPGTDIAGA